METINILDHSLVALLLSLAITFTKNEPIPDHECDTDIGIPDA